MNEQGQPQTALLPQELEHLWLEHLKAEFDERIYWDHASVLRQAGLLK